MKKALESEGVPHLCTYFKTTLCFYLDSKIVIFGKY